MYKVTNISLEDKFKDWKINDLNELSDQDLIRFCTDNKRGVGLSPQYKRDPELKTIIKPLQFARFDTIDYILANYSISFYMSSEYWDLRHGEEAADRDLERRLKDVTRGEDTYKLFANLKWGVYQLKPMESVELDLSDRFVEEFLNFEREVEGTKDPKTGEYEKNWIEKSPYLKSLRIVNLSEGAEDHSAKTVDLNTMSFREKQAFAIEKNKELVAQGKEKIKAFGVTEETLTNSLAELI